MEPPDSHISTTANDQKPHVHSLISGAKSALPDNQSPSNRWHFTWGATLLHSCSAVKNLYFFALLAPDTLPVLGVLVALGSLELEHL